MKESGYNIIRFTNYEVLNNLESVLLTIKDTLSGIKSKL